uniref:Uncharacterized protein n=1 Tax=Arundo donax TaxID=35708 RepID=A0A0A9CS59_ARUDO
MSPTPRPRPLPPSRAGEMEKSISALCGSLSSVLDHADTSSRALTDAVSRCPIHLGNLSPYTQPQVSLHPAREARGGTMPPVRRNGPEVKPSRKGHRRR